MNRLLMGITFSFLLAIVIIIGVNALLQTISRKPTSEGPNVVLIISDDQRYDSLSAMPFLNDLKSNGTTFTNGYVTTPLCCPSRSSILSGQYAHNHGVLSNRAPSGGFDAFRDSSTLPVWLQEAGYQTALMGKYLNGYSNEDADYKPPGWDVFHAFVNEPGYTTFRLTRHNQDGHQGVTTYLPADDAYSTDLLAEESAAFIRDTAKQPKRPFFLVYTPYAPHGPATPPARYLSEASSDEQRPNYNEADVSDKQSWFDQRPPLTPEEEERIIDLKNRTAGTLHALDDGIRTIFEALTAAGVADNTVIIYLADNGFHWGEHRIPFGKMTPYEESIHVPFIVYDGRNQTARLDNRLSLNIDIAPTIADFAGIPVPDGLDGRSLINPDFSRKYFLSENWEGQLSPYTSVHSDDLVLIRFAGGEQELYDLARDPFELTNLINDPDYSLQKSELQTALDRLDSCSGESCQE